MDAIEILAGVLREAGYNLRFTIFLSRRPRQDRGAPWISSK
jgi:hypothetical protein